MIVVTGGAGFIGANIIHGLNQRGLTDILLVDDLTNTNKVRNIADLQIADFLDKREFRKRIQSRSLKGISAIFHEGACSDTMATDGCYVMDNNYEYSKDVFAYSKEFNCQFIYASSASVYGNNTVFSEAVENEKPLNAYAYSKFQFDRYLLTQEYESQVVGLRYFNVYGYREQHKSRMASVAWHFFNQFRDTGKLQLFEGSGGYENGEQRRDFVFIEDIVNINLFFLDNPGISGVFNAGTGASASFNDVAVAVINTLNGNIGKTKATLSELKKTGLINYVPMPEALHGKYQSFTEADIQRLRNAGYGCSFSDVSDGVAKYVSWLEKHCDK